MRWRVDDHGRLVLTVTGKERRRLQAAQRRGEKGGCEMPFGSDGFMHRLLEPLVTNDGYAWVSGCTGDPTSDPTLGILGGQKTNWSATCRRRRIGGPAARSRW
jgi:hypothetical protein